MAYRMGHPSPLMILLNQQNPATVERSLRYNDYFLQARLKKIQEFQASVSRVNQAEEVLQQALADLRDQSRVLAQQQTLLQTQRQERERTLLALRGQIKTKNGSLIQLTRDKAALAKVLVATRATMGRLPTPKDYQFFTQGKGRLSWPAQGRLLNRFGSVRNGSMRWDGVMIDVPVGTPVTVIHAGRVVYADWLSGLGLLMIVDHGGGYMSLYAHNTVLLKEVGEWIRSGDTIARSGDSGAEQTPGLYFEIRYQGEPVDPTRWCR